MWPWVVKLLGSPEEGERFKKKEKKEEIEVEGAKSGAASICLTGLETYAVRLQYEMSDQIAGDRLGVFSAFTAFSFLYDFYIMTQRLDTWATCRLCKKKFREKKSIRETSFL